MAHTTPTLTIDEQIRAALTGDGFTLLTVPVDSIEEFYFGDGWRWVRVDDIGGGRCFAMIDGSVERRIRVTGSGQPIGATSRVWDERLLALNEVRFTEVDKVRIGERLREAVDFARRTSKFGTPVGEVVGTMTVNGTLMRVACNAIGLREGELRDSEREWIENEIAKMNARHNRLIVKVPQ